MLKSNYWILVLFIFAFVLSCKKQIDLQQESPAEDLVSSRASDDCLNLPHFCVADQVIAPDPTNVFARVSGGSGSWNLYFYELAPNETSFIAIRDDGTTTMLTKTENPYLLEKGSSNGVPPELLATLDLPREKMQTQSLNSETIIGVYGEECHVQLNGDIPHLTVENDFDYPLNPNSVGFDGCEMVFEATVMAYMNNLDIPISSQSTYEAVVEEALIDCAGNDNPISFHCIQNNCNSECVLSNILSHPVFSGSEFLTQQLKIYYLDLLVGIPEESFNQYLATENKDVVNQMFDFYMDSNNNICETLQDFSNLENPVQIPTPPKVHANLIGIMNTFGVSVGCNKTNEVGTTNDRHPLDEDLQFGTNANVDFIPKWVTDDTDQELFLKWNELNAFTTIMSAGSSNPMKPVADYFLTVVESNQSSSTEVSDIRLSNKCADSESMKDFIRNFSIEFNDELRSGTPLNDVYIDMGEIHPKWGSDYRFMGLQILINDSEQTKIYLDEFTWTVPNQEWEATFCFNVRDHYGLDLHDAELYGPRHPGFYAWWLLQHDRGYAPFITRIYIKAKVWGKFGA